MGSGWVFWLIWVSTFKRSVYSSTAVEYVNCRTNSCSRVGVGDRFRVSVSKGTSITNPIRCPKYSMFVVKGCQCSPNTLLLSNGSCESWEHCPVGGNIAFLISVKMWYEISGYTNCPDWEFATLQNTCPALCDAEKRSGQRPSNQCNSYDPLDLRVHEPDHEVTQWSRNPWCLGLKSKLDYQS